MGRKIKRHNHIYKRKKSKAKQAVYAFLGVLVMLVLVVIGYSVGKPLFEFLSRDVDTSEPISSWSPEESEAVSLPLGEESEVTRSTTASVPDVAGEEQPSGDYIAVRLNPAALSSKTDLSSFVSAAKNDGYNQVVVELKNDVGNVLYATNLETIKGNTDVVTGTLTLDEIVAEIKKNGLEPVAKINTLKDHIASRGMGGVDGTGYKFEDEFTTWLDNYPDRGGKPWLAPYYDTTRKYLCGLTDEITKAGFTGIIFSNVIFPTFYDYDYIYIGARVQSADRYTSLAAVVTEGKIAAENNGAEFILEVSAKDLLADAVEVLKSTEILPLTLMVTYDIVPGSKINIGTKETQIPANVTEAVGMVYTEVLKKTKDIEVIACIDSDFTGKEKQSEAVASLKNTGIQKYIVK